jgi:[ribosomal protein S18]-alanine N-acetyltransferase
VPEKRHQVRLQQATPEFAGEISALHGSLFEKAWDVDGVRRLLEHPASVALVATTERPWRVIGFILAQLTADEAEILSLGVGATSQRVGIGKMLVQGLTDTAQRKGVKRIFLDVAAGNAAAIGLYRAMGFAEMGRRKDYYSHAGGRREDALLMVRDLGFN